MTYVESALGFICMILQKHCVLLLKLELNKDVIQVKNYYVPNFLLEVI